MLYSNYNIAEKINIVICPMSFKQFEKYETSYSNEKLSGNVEIYTKTEEHFNAAKNCYIESFKNIGL